MFRMAQINETTHQCHCGEIIDLTDGKCECAKCGAKSVPMTQQGILEGLQHMKSQLEHRNKMRTEVLAEVKGRHEAELQELEQKLNQEQDDEVKAHKLSEMKQKHSKEREQYKKLDEQLERQDGLERRYLHEQGINFCNDCFKLLKVGVVAVSFNMKTMHRMPLSAQYCDDCAVKRPGTKRMTDWDYM